MARVFLQKTLSGLVPADEASREVLKKYRAGEVYRCDIVKPRSYQHHKLCMALLNLTYDNLPEKYAKCYATFDQFRYAVAMDSGHAESFVSLDGEIVTIPKSISYDAIPDDVEFGRIMSGMMAVCASILGVDQPHLQMEVERYASSHYGWAAA